MKHMPNGIPILYERKNTIDFSDEFGKYKMVVYLRLVWNKGLYWGISTGDFSTWNKSLPQCIMDAIQILLKGNLTPCYYRLKEHKGEKNG